MLAILNSLNAHNLPIFQPILMILVSKFIFQRAFSNKTYLSLGLLFPLMAFFYGFTFFLWIIGFWPWISYFMPWKMDLTNFQSQKKNGKIILSIFGMENDLVLFWYQRALNK